jgi:hypothetical protein
MLLIIIKFGPRYNKSIRFGGRSGFTTLSTHEEGHDYDDPLQYFSYALRAPGTNMQYPKREFYLIF